MILNPCRFRIIKIYSEYFDDSKPARVCVEVSNLPKGADVEMDAIAEISSVN